MGGTACCSGNTLDPCMDKKARQIRGGSTRLGISAVAPQLPTGFNDCHFVVHPEGIRSLV
jgi:hypothetical protein